MIEQIDQTIGQRAARIARPTRRQWRLEKCAHRGGQRCTARLRGLRNRLALQHQVVGQHHTMTALDGAHRMASIGVKRHKTKLPCRCLHAQFIIVVLDHEFAAGE